jgi:hypothetical protein
MPAQRKKTGTDRLPREGRADGIEPLWNRRIGRIRPQNVRFRANASLELIEIKAFPFASRHCLDYR